MDAVIALAVSGATLVAILAALVWLARRVRRSGVGAQVMGPIDEVFNADGHRSRQIIHITDQRMISPAGADDQPPSTPGQPTAVTEAGRGVRRPPG